MNPLVDLMTMNFPFATEIVCVFMAIEGSMKVRAGPNRTGSMHWFHAFLKSTFTSFAGATFTNVFLGKPTAMFSNDVFFGSCVLGYGLVNWLPFDLGYLVLNTFPGALVTNVFSQVFRVSGVVGFSDAAFDAFRAAPSKYYPTPIFGPILFPSTLGNMGGFFGAGVDGYLGKGLPWGVQQGVFCSTFYHFYAHDAEGCVGRALRSSLRPSAVWVMASMGAEGDEMGDDALFARFAIGVFIVLLGILRMPQFLGERFSPFMTVSEVATRAVWGQKGKVSAKPPSKKSKKKKQ